MWEARCVRRALFFIPALLPSPSARALFLAGNTGHCIMIGIEEASEETFSFATFLVRKNSDDWTGRPELHVDVICIHLTMIG